MKKISTALVDSLPVFAAYFPLGVVWGLLWEQAGFPPLWGILFSFFVYAGAVQFLALSWFATGDPLTTLVATVFPVAMRNGFYTVAMIDRLPTNPLLRAYSSFGLADATFALLISKPEEQAKDLGYSLPLTFIIQLWWAIGTAVGVYCGTFIPDSLSGLDFALPSLIAILAMEQLLKIGSWKPLIVTVVAAAVARVAFGHSWLLPAMAICAASVIYDTKTGRREI